MMVEVEACLATAPFFQAFHFFRFTLDFSGFVLLNRGRNQTDSSSGAISRAAPASQMTAQTARYLDSTQVSGREVLPTLEEVTESFIDEKSTLQGWLDLLYETWADGSFIDPRGNVWLDTRSLPVATRVPALVDLTLFHPSGDETRLRQGRLYLRGSRVSRLLDSIVAGTERDNREHLERIAINGEVSRELYTLVRDSALARRRQESTLDSLNEVRTHLRKQRIRRHALLEDELTGEKLQRPTFVYIRHPALYPELAENPDNGLAVNRSTLETLRHHRSTDENELFRIAHRRQWARDWYPAFLRQIASS